MTRVSAIVTAFNVESYIATAIQSIIDTGFEDLELIVVDDGSTDATRRVIDVITSSAARERVHCVPIYFANNTVGGVASAANTGLDHASGDVVVFVDGDDWVLPHNLRAAVKMQLNSKADFTVCGCQEYWNDTGAYTFYPEAHLWNQIAQCSGVEARRQLLLQMAPFPWRKVYRRSFLERYRIRFPVGDYFFEDNPFHWETSVRADKFNFFAPVTHVHRMARQGQTVSSMGMRSLQVFEHARTIRNLLEQTEQGKELEQCYFQWLADHVLWCARHVPPEGLNLLFNLAADAFASFTDDIFWEWLSEKKRNLLDVRLLTAVQLQDRLGFLQASK
ncbi:glycosyltransferase family 2 protein [Leisingera sp.]|uniref:glycosyltransferase family 2 protein n=1 Tax=Leisingera sp. TaxID=1879318 RepID=UPI003A8FEFEA